MKITTIVLMLSLLLVFSISANYSPVYAQKNKKTSVVKKTATNQKGSLSIEAGLLYRNGDVKPAARIEFYLLDADLEKILEDSGMETSRYGESYISHYALQEYASRQVGIPTIKSQQAKTAIKSHSAASVTTDFNGKGKFPAVKAGKYYLYGVGGTGNQVVIWNLSIDIKAGSQSVALDNNNAAKIL